MTRGRGGSLHLPRTALPSATPCRFIPAHWLSPIIWTLKKSVDITITGGSPFDMDAHVRYGYAGGYGTSPDVPAGQVGLWCGDSSDNSFDEFKVSDVAGPFVADGKWFSNRGGVQVDSSDNNVLQDTNADSGTSRNCIIRRGFRGDKYVATFKFKWDGTTNPGWVVRWLDPGNFLAVAVKASDSTARLYQRADSGNNAILVTAGSALTLSTGNWYEAKVVIDDDPNNAVLQRLRFWVDTDDDGDYSDEATLITTTEVDDEWSAGYVGLFGWGAGTQEYDNVTIGYDNNSDGDIDDAGDDIQVSDDFNSNAMTLTYDDNGNLTNDGVYQYVYDGWNRLVGVQRVAVGDTTTVAAYEYDGKNRRTAKTVTKCGIEHVAILDMSASPTRQGQADGGNTAVHYYYDNRWRIVETRDGSGQTLAQYAWGTGGTGVSPVSHPDELLFIDVNGDAIAGDDCDPDVSDPNDASPDRRYFVHQDRNWNVTALTAYNADPNDPNQPPAGSIVERYAYTPYGEFVVLTGEDDNGIETAQPRLTSLVGNVFAHQGLPLDAEKGSYQNRHREYMRQLGRFGERDPLGVSYLWRVSWREGQSSIRDRKLTPVRQYTDGSSLYLYANDNPVRLRDAVGLSVCDAAQQCLDAWWDDYSDCIAENGVEWEEACKNLADSHRDPCVAALTDPCVTAPPSPPSSCCYPRTKTYSGVNAQCMCKCMGTDPWSSQVRSCIRCYYKAGCSDRVTHETCYARADLTQSQPWVKLMRCALGCM